MSLHAVKGAAGRQQERNVSVAFLALFLAAQQGALSSAAVHAMFPVPNKGAGMFASAEYSQ